MEQRRRDIRHELDLLGQAPKPLPPIIGKDNTDIKALRLAAAKAEANTRAKPGARIPPPRRRQVKMPPQESLEERVQRMKQGQYYMNEDTAARRRQQVPTQFR